MTIPKHLLNAKICNRDTCEEIRILKKENNDLRRIYRNTYKHLFEIGNEELARYFMAQIDDCPTFYVEPIVDYYEENQRLKERIEYLERSNNRREDTIMGLRDEIIDQKDYENVLNELEKWVYQFREEHKNDTGIFDKFLTTREVLDKIKKLKESDK